jgi:UDP:flavonoid glycosyltransferase YjiC (YdhE family)
MAPSPSGVVNATLRAGIPIVISPLMGDQFFWADLVADKKVGTRTAMLPALTKEDILKGIAEAKNCQANAKRVSVELKQLPLGVEQMQKLPETDVKAS